MKFLSIPENTSFLFSLKHHEKHETVKSGYDASTNITRHDVVRQDGDVLFAVRPRVLVVETQSVKNLVHDITHDARRSDEHGLLATDEAHVWRTAAI